MNVELRYHRLQLPRKRFEIATGVRDIVDVFIVEVTYEGLTGFGSGTPATVVQDSPAKCEKALMRARCISIDPDEYFKCELNSEITETSPSAAAALDIALWDLLAKRMHMPLARVIGGSPKDLMTDATIDLKSPKDSAEEAGSFISQGYRTLKIKVGRDITEDIKRVEAVRRVAGEDVRLTVDANGGYDLDGARRFWSGVAQFGIAMFEQPVPGGLVEDLGKLKNEHGIPVCADESVSTEDTLVNLIEKKAASAINIKLMKCGGLSMAKRMGEIARKHGMELMLGCMGDIGFSIAASAHLACSVSPEYVDLDSHLNIEQVCNGPAVRNGNLIVEEKDGLGVRLMDAWTKWRV